MKINELKRKFIDIYGGKEDGIRVFSSPGRVNLIGEHTDYNGGYVFPAALTLCSKVAVRPRKDRKVNLIAADLNKLVTADLDRLDEYRKLEWGNYQLGVADELQKSGLQLVGCDMLFDDQVPLGAGLSSSAAIEIAAALAFKAVSNPSVENGSGDMIELAKLAQRAENRYVGVNCGIMDQFASAMGKKDHAIFLNCRNMEYKYVRLKLDGYKIVISNTNKKRSLADSKYNERRSECEKGLEQLKEYFPEIKCLGELIYEGVVDKMEKLGDNVIKQRLMHVISENDRVIKSVKALEENDIASFGRLMIQSHESLRDLYEVTGYELDSLVEEALKIQGVIGSRMTGAGFGGCTVSIVRDDAVERFIFDVGENYYRKTGLRASFYISEIGDGGREIIV
ncbi:MAG TPA: galactokinase [Clostridia bacterium]|nr:galactokinase [Clostridia bacterium]